MSLKVHCPKCRAAVRIPDALVGKPVRCPGCKHAMSVRPPKSRTNGQAKAAPQPVTMLAGAAAPSSRTAAKPTVTVKKTALAKAPARVSAGNKPHSAPAASSRPAAKKASASPAPAAKKAPAPQAPAAKKAPAPQAPAAKKAPSPQAPAAKKAPAASPKPAVKQQTAAVKQTTVAPAPVAVPPPRRMEPAPVATKRPAAPPVDDDEQQGLSPRMKIAAAGVVGFLVLYGLYWLLFTGSDLGFVSGTIKLAGEPLGDAQVVFVGESGSPGPFTVKTAPNGTYTLRSNTNTGVPAGKYKVTVSKVALKDGTIPSSREEMANAVRTGQLRNIVRKDHEDAATTPLFAEVKSGSIVKDFDVPKQP